ncbi:hypothetical protein FWK35_00023102, partial [Aphis craccivora]
KKYLKIFIFKNLHQKEIRTINSERSDECIDFTMLCVFFFCLCTQERVEIMLEFQTLRVVSD